MSEPTWSDREHSKEQKSLGLTLGGHLTNQPPQIRKLMRGGLWAESEGPDDCVGRRGMHREWSYAVFG